MKTVYIAGCWDLLHEGHMNILREGRKLADWLVVAVNSDAFVESYKKVKMAQDENVRLKNIRDLFFVDMAFILEDWESQRDYIDILKPCMIFHGSDWKDGSLYKQMNITEKQIEDYGIQFVYPQYTPGVSSTMLREKLK